ncbi:MAG: glycine cleavage system aminomethyltransferase GcvT [Succiniclasticum sp.]|jgi:aminomethyltransferase
MGKKTPLYDVYARYNGKIVPFGGYLLPVQFKGVIEEHMAVRTTVGLFDVSHMGEITCRGKDALNFLNYILTNDYTSLKDGSARYSPMCNERGGVVDDLIVYKLADGDYLIVVNAATKDKDYAWMRSHVRGDCRLEDVSDQYVQLALQGPKAEAVLRELLPDEAIPRKSYTARFHVDLQGTEVILSRTGYTGEDGFELYFAVPDAEKIWCLLLETGRSYGILPCGLGARDTLRLEAGMPLYGHEMTEDITPLEAGLGRFVKLEKENFVGKEALVAAGEPQRVHVGLKVTGRGIVRENMDLYSHGTVVGRTTSGTYCPFVKRPIAMALVERACAAVGTPLEADVRGRRVAVEVEGLPFYTRKK